VNDLVHQLPHVNAALNTLAALLLVWGYLLIKRGKVIAHRNVMLAAFGVSVLFLACYLAHHIALYLETGSGSKKFPGHYGSLIVAVYRSILFPHIVLAAAVPFLAVITIYHGLTDDRPRHRKWAWRTFPIWLFVSITGVIVYVMLYHLYPDLPPAQ
jgi:uncharacterized membrane protein YozB (DUF420 family)